MRRVAEHDDARPRTRIEPAKSSCNRPKNTWRSLSLSLSKKEEHVRRLGSTVARETRVLRRHGVAVVERRRPHLAQRRGRRQSAREIPHLVRQKIRIFQLCETLKTEFLPQKRKADALVGVDARVSPESTALRERSLSLKNRRGFRVTSPHPSVRRRASWSKAAGSCCARGAIEKGAVLSVHSSLEREVTTPPTPHKDAGQRGKRGARPGAARRRRLWGVGTRVAKDASLNRKDTYPETR